MLHRSTRLSQKCFHFDNLFVKISDYFQLFPEKNLHLFCLVKSARACDLLAWCCRHGNLLCIVLRLELPEGTHLGTRGGSEGETNLLSPSCRPQAQLQSGQLLRKDHSDPWGAVLALSIKKTWFAFLQMLASDNSWTNSAFMGWEHGELWLAAY